MNEGSAHLEAFTSARIGIDLELKRVFGRIAGGCLVVKNREGSWYPALVVKNHICPAAHRDAIEMEFEGTLRLPNTAQVRLM